MAFEDHNEPIDDLTETAQSALFEEAMAQDHGLRCQACGGVPGPENVVDDRILCADCHAALLASLASQHVATHGPFKLMSTSVETTSTPTFSEWESALDWCQKVEKASPWWVGDLIEMGEQVWGEKYSQALDHTKYTEQALRDICYVTRQVAPSVRRPDVSFTHHREIAPLPPESQAAWLKRTADENLTTLQLRTHVRAEKATREGNGLDLWVLVKCDSVDDQLELMDRMKLEGRAVKAQHGKHAPVVESAS